MNCDSYLSILNGLLFKPTNKVLASQSLLARKLSFAKGAALQIRRLSLKYAPLMPSILEEEARWIEVQAPRFGEDIKGIQQCQNRLRYHLEFLHPKLVRTTPG